MSENKKTHKCSYQFCFFDNSIIEDGEVKKNNRYYHKKCAETIDDINDIKKVYLSKVSNTVVMKFLMNVVRNIIFGKNVESGLLLFSIQYAIKNGIEIKSPYSLYYLVDNLDIKIEYEKKKIKEKISQLNKKSNETNEDPFATIKKSNTNSFKSSKNNHIGFGDIL